MKLNVFVYNIIYHISYLFTFILFSGVKDAGKKGHCEYIRPPIDKYATMQFDKFDEIREVCKKKIIYF